MKTTLGFVGFLLLATAAAQQHDEPHPKGVIYGIAINQEGQPAKRIGLIAEPLGVGMAAKLPYTSTNDAGEYRFEDIPWWGRYTVYADDENEGYSSFSTGSASDSSPPEVEITPEHPEAELKVLLPPKAGFIQIHLTNQRTGAGISGMRVALMPTESPASPLFTMSCYSAGCHGADGAGKPGMKAPALKGINLEASRIAEHITKGESTSKPPHNKGMAGLTDPQAKTIAEYVKTLK